MADSEIVAYLKAQKKDHLDEAKRLAMLAKSEARAMTDDEKDAAKGRMQDAADLDVKIRAIQESEQMQVKIEELGAGLESDIPEDLTGAASAGSIGRTFVTSDSFRALQARGTKGKFWMQPIQVESPTVSRQRRRGLYGANEGIVFEGQGNNAEMFLPQRIPGILGPVEAPLALADLFAQGIITNGNSVLLVKETVTDNAADIVAERGPKPASDIQFDTVPVTLEKIATVIKVSTEMLEDEASMENYLNDRLGLFVEQREEEELVTDLLAEVADQESFAADIDGENVFDAIMAGAVDVRREGGLDADAVAMTMLDFAKLSVAKTDQGIYYSGGPYQSAGTLLWGRFRVAIAERLGDGNMVVGAFRNGGRIWRKAGGVTVDATNSNEDDFLKNLTAIRAEERMKLFLERPQAFRLVSQTS